MNPLAAHRHRTQVGMHIRAEVMLDICYIMAPMTYNEIKKLGMQEELGSPVALHNALHWLVDNGYLKERTAFDDHRAKLLEITKLGVSYLRKFKGAGNERL